MTDFLVPEFELSVGGTVLTPELENHVVEISVVTEADFAGHLTLTLANAFPDLPFTHGDHATLFAVGAPVVVKLGYGDTLETVFEGDVTALGASFPDDTGPTLVVEAQTAHHRLRGNVRTRTFVDMTDSDAASDVLGQSGVAFEVESTSTQHPYLIQFNETDLAFLAERARLIRFVLVHEDGKLRFRAPSESESATLGFVWGDGATAAAAAGSFPLRRFGSTVEALRPVTEVVVRGLDPLTREPVVGTVTSGSASTGGATAGPAAREQALGARSEQIVDVPVASADEAQAIAQAVYDRRAMEYVSATAVAPGVPGLRAGRVVEVSGCGAYDGKYWVTRAAHRFSGRGYETAFSARSDSLG